MSGDVGESAEFKPGDFRPQLKSRKTCNRIWQSDDEKLRGQWNRRAGNDTVCVGGLGRVAVGKDGDITALSETLSRFKSENSTYKKLSEWLSKLDLWDGLLRSKRAEGCLHPIRQMSQLDGNWTKGIMLTIWTTINLCILVTIFAFSQPSQIVWA